MIVKNYQESRLDKTQASGGRIERQKSGQNGKFNLSLDILAHCACLLGGF